jgi:hypothetical protein
MDELRGPQASVMNTIMILRFHKCGQFLDKPKDYCVCKNASVVWL